jgi:hypothetical protein
VASGGFKEFTLSQSTRTQARIFRLLGIFRYLAMVKIGLQISCQFENIEELKTEKNYSYFVKLQCNNCGENDGIWHDLCEEVSEIDHF